ncbi:Kinetochore complex Sim4 subunit Fta4 [Fusarium acuminatum]|uniref:Kinetochore complex Sim4 subunit Fta4 n=1 Tax=Fusarium acuminatum TaxID=5515 RepID=A0ABZ2XE35_9HYPO
MVKPLYIAYALFAAAGVQAGCVRNCDVTADKDGLCSYACTNACKDISAEEARNKFLGALKSRKYRCSSNGRTGLQCGKEGTFGNCEDHYWSCGRDC